MGWDGMGWDGMGWDLFWVVDVRCSMFDFDAKG